MNLKTINTHNLLKSTVILISVILLSFLFSKLGTIHGKELPEEYFSGGYPTILKLLDSEFFLGLIFLVTLSVFAYVAYLLLQLHKVAVHKAEQKSSSQVQLVFALSLCGLFIHKAWWVLAVIIAFTSWDQIAESISRMIHKGVHSDVDLKADLKQHDVNSGEVK